MDPSTIRIEDGGGEGRGSRFDGNGTHFAVYSAHASKIELCLFDDNGAETARIPLPGKTGDVFHGYVPELAPGQLYGFRAHGPWDPASGHRFNPNKLLLDPYAREIVGELAWNEAFRDDNALDSAPFAPKSRVVGPMAPPAPGPGTPWRKTMIYEAHPKGQTMTAPHVPAGLRGTMMGLALEAAYVEGLGFTAIELMPVHAKAHDDDWLHKTGRKNYWGYNTLGFFAVTPSYLKTGRREECRDLVDTIHERNLEVILDVVYNHTGEANENGPALCLRGLDNATYYRMAGPYYIDETGCRNTLDFTHPETRRLVLDSLRYWATEMRVDGFRFDLGPILGKTEHGFEAMAPLLTEIAADPVLSRVKMIIEPWGPVDYQLGRFPAPFAEWNDQFRDDTRKFWRGDGTAGALATRLAGSAGIFAGRAATSSINFVACHDGMTLNDVVSYSCKNNFGNLEDNRDGTNNDYSQNHGTEGETNDPAINELRARQVRNMLATVFLAQGTPMMLAGDECGNSQGGNNNAYCQDNETGWMTRADDDMPDFVRQLTSLRRAFPALRQETHLHGNNFCAHGGRDLAWFAPSGREMAGDDWNGNTLGMLLNEGAMSGGPGPSLLAVFNGSAAKTGFVLPAPPCGGGWELVLDTVEPKLLDALVRAPCSVWEAEAKSVAVFRLRQ